MIFSQGLRASKLVLCKQYDHVDHTILETMWLTEYYKKETRQVQMIPVPRPRQKSPIVNR
jgi:hypothetical protein